MENLTAIILAAGKGTRMNSVDTNKVAMNVGGEPMISRTVKTLQESGISSLIVVVGFAKESVVKVLPQGVLIAEQVEQLGTGHAVMSALPQIPGTATDVLILNGDDAFLYAPSDFKKLHEIHKSQNATLTLVSMHAKSPTGFGRIIRFKGDIKGIVEEKNATDEQRKITEINLGCYIINKDYLVKNLSKIDKNLVTREYYITDMIDFIASENKKISSYILENSKWQGVNTPEDLKAAEKLLNI